MEISKGPWKFNKKLNIYHWGKGPETKGYRPCIAQVSNWKDASEEAKANAKAISSVPDMIETLKHTRNIVILELTYDENADEVQETLRDTLNKIEDTLDKAGIAYD